MAARTIPVYSFNVLMAGPPGGISLEAASVMVGSSPDNELTVTATCLNRGGYVQGYVFLQARQNVNDTIDHNYSDEFALQVIQLSPDSVTFRIKRLDRCSFTRLYRLRRSCSSPSVRLLMVPAYSIYTGIARSWITVPIERTENSMSDKQLLK